ncbi:MAG: hypothetical protein JSR59_26665 [Proteobacteria bacterium]|nr:hypothetical protein [Pseudomonadota bacterium]
MPPEASIACPSASEWMRIFACRLAQRRPELDARAVVDAAVDQFKAWHGTAPEIAAEQWGQSGLMH